MCTSIGESKRYNQILIQPIPGREGSFGNVFRMDFDLTITQIKIDLGKDFCTSKLIKKNIDAGQWILVLAGDNI
jgi:hypothetical protein